MIRYDITELRLSVNGHGSILVRSEMKESARGAWVSHDEAVKQQPPRVQFIDWTTLPVTLPAMLEATRALGIDPAIGAPVAPYIEIDGKRFFLVSLE